MTLALARVLAPKIRVNAVAPGFITGRWLQTGLGGAYEAVKKNHEGRTPMKRVCEPEDVAAAILSLVTGSDLVTGQSSRSRAACCSRSDSGVPVCTGRQPSVVSRRARTGNAPDD